jgi:hypothetical protein
MAEPRPKTPALNAEATIGRLGEFLAMQRDGKWAENSLLAHRNRAIQNPIADFGTENPVAKFRSRRQSPGGVEVGDATMRTITRSAPQLNVRHGFNPRS